MLVPNHMLTNALQCESSVKCRVSYIMFYIIIIIIIIISYIMYILG